MLFLDVTPCALVTTIRRNVLPYRPLYMNTCTIFCTHLDLSQRKCFFFNPETNIAQRVLYAQYPLLISHTLCKTLTLYYSPN